MIWFPIEHGYINLGQAIKIVNDGSIITVVFGRGETESIPAARWNELSVHLGEHVPEV